MSKVWLLRRPPSAEDLKPAGSTADVGTQTKIGLLAQLQKGYQVGKPPYGYKIRKDITEFGQVVGTHWALNEDEASVVRRAFELRASGQSGDKIAEIFNTENLPPPGHRRANAADHWRSSSIHRLLTTQTYRGVFVWNNTLEDPERAGTENKTVEAQTFDRPHLRIVSDELWFKVNPGSAGRSQSDSNVRGGGVNALAGLVQCGVCGGRCVVGSGNGSGSIFCNKCDEAVRTGQQASWLGYSSVAAANQALGWALRQAISAQELQLVFRDRLGKHLSQSQGDEQKITRAQLQQILASTQAEDLIDDLFDKTKVAPYRARTILHRVLETFEYVGRPAKGESVFHIAVKTAAGKTHAAGNPDAATSRQGDCYEVSTKIIRKNGLAWVVTGKRLVPQVGSTLPPPSGDATSH